ncbi:large proline-rich protein BAG6 isoform X3 [Bradysia coprophila]|uniref:large proline-rich protein BAG6 isoform X3 n=1 Tax=Bradysia coprophila TaxID=38358 RepID=UPI00187D84D7|nr:large proline-rich protein BAG6 isoform X3 [Bradysia coprophila]
MISLKIKTLDSQDHDFTVEDDITVRQFKEHIASNTGISADMQRLIYCGRVLNDEKPLREYDVNGKVVHLVERPPPRANRSGDTATSNASSTPQPSQNSRRSNNFGDAFRRALDLDGMVVGAMAIPMGGNAGSTHGLTTTVNPSSTLCMNRIAVARHMLECANNIVTFLENPERGLNNSEMDMLAQQTLESTVFELGISAVSDADVPQQDVQNFVSAVQGAMSAAFRQNGLTNIELTTQSGSSDGSGGGPSILFGGNATPLIVHGTVPPPQPPSGLINPQGEVEVASVRVSVPNRSQSATSSPTRNGDDTATSNGSNPAGATPSRNQTTSPQVLAEVVQQMRTVQSRMEPYVQQYYDLLQNDPAFEESDTTGRENAQRVFDRVSEALHYMSHAQHAISDLMLNLSLTTPRHLCCRPILVEQSAFVSSGIAIPNLVRRQDAGTNNGNNNETATANNNNTAPTAAVTPGQRIEVPLTGPVPSTVEIISAPATSTQPSSESNDGGNGIAAAAAQGAVNRQLHVARLIQAVVNSVPMYADVHVEINPRNGSDQTSPQSTNGSTPQSAAAQSTTAETSPLNGENAAGTPINNELTITVDLGADQPRVTTATHPTTSTQTRSTARPQVHLASIPATHMRSLRPVPIPSIQLSSFDRFLPCNSHHVRQNQDVNARPQHFHVAHPRRDEIANRDSDQAIRLFGCEIPIRDLINLTPSPSVFNRIRSDLQAYVTQRFGTPPDMTGPFAHILNVLHDSCLSSSFSHPSYNALHSVNNLIHHTLPTVVSLILNDDSDQFGVRILRTLNEFIRRLFIILMILGGYISAKQFLAEMITIGLQPNRRGVVRALQSRVIQAIARRLQTFQRITDEVAPEVQEFLVIHLEGPPVTSSAASSSSPQPMETDDVIPTTSTEEPITDDEILPSPPTAGNVLAEASAPIDTEPLPNVVVGSESWHNGMPPTWLPVITRDMGRQRRQSPQAPYSDAYLCGMSSKRRKLISSTKPSGSNPSQILTDTLRQVIQSQSNANSIMLTTEESLAAHPHIQEPYGSFEQAVRSNIQKRIESDPDYNPERYPNCAKWMNSKK